MIADQRPTVITPEAVENASLKVIHRRVSADDHNELGQAITSDVGQIEQAATLSRHRAFVHIFRKGVFPFPKNISVCQARVLCY